MYEMTASISDGTGMLCDVIEHTEQYCMKLIKFTYYLRIIQHTDSNYHNDT
jgi:hypothetical protein